jgi:CO/xanthine dehydrogenase Mo-binding subunit
MIAMTATWLVITTLAAFAGWKEDYRAALNAGNQSLEIHPLEEMADGASGTWNARSAGSAGAIAAPAAIANAIHAAVARFGVEHIDPPLTPARIWEAIHEAEEREGR